ncbi:tyrosine-type recombinase/integrase [Desulfotalea psychrophila]|uniref:Related to integrase/recombinase n=1 Tax=Desulfotalea psychrophila (strain LSv54 / DSM 12343) TaxID=177439 RepID=Q6AMU1_DESPS|nr:site-specific integrase [Desulfotalea psychrophila]CAG36333.1 related to integrase/recombinase [Desulfotalea psychrophila LSv54]
MATFKKRENKSGIVWEAHIRIKGHTPRRKSFPTKCRAQAWAVEYEALLRAKDAGDPRLAEQISLQEALDKYAEDSTAAGKKESTLDLESRATRHLTRLLGADRSLADIRPALVAQYQLTRQKEGYSNSAIRTELAILSKMYNNARKIWGLNIKNPVNDITRVPPDKGNTRFLTTAEAKIVLDESKNIRNPKFYPFVLLLMHTGMRSSEVARLRPEDINFETLSLRIHETKSGIPRSVPLTTKAAEVLQTVSPEATGYYFLKENHLNQKDIRLAPAKAFSSCWRSLRKKMEASGHKIPHFRPHDLRHTAASHLLMAGVDIREVADILGHSTLAMTMRYTHLLDSRRQETISKINHLGE